MSVDDGAAKHDLRMNGKREQGGEDRRAAEELHEGAEREEIARPIAVAIMNFS